jgi:hypothetical protein
VFLVLNSKLLRLKTLFVVFYYLRFRNAKPMLLGVITTKMWIEKRAIGAKTLVKA